MKILRMMIAMLGILLGIGSGVSARKAGAGARAGLPNLYTELGVDRDVTGKDLAEKMIDRLVAVRGDKNKLRKLSGSYQLFLQSRPLWQNVGLDEDDRNDAEELGEKYAEVVKMSAAIAQEIKQKKSILSRSKEEENDLKDGMLIYDFMMTHIIKEIGRQFEEWKKNNPSKVADAMEAYRDKMGETGSSDFFEQLDIDRIIESDGNEGGTLNLDDDMFQDFDFQGFY